MNLAAREGAGKGERGGVGGGGGGSAPACLFESIN